MWNGGFYWQDSAGVTGKRRKNGITVLGLPGRIAKPYRENRLCKKNGVKSETVVTDGRV